MLSLELSSGAEFAGLHFSCCYFSLRHAAAGFFHFNNFPREPSWNAAASVPPPRDATHTTVVISKSHRIIYFPRAAFRVDGCLRCDYSKLHSMYQTERSESCNGIRFDRHPSTVTMRWNAREHPNQEGRLRCSP